MTGPRNRRADGWLTRGLVGLVVLLWTLLVIQPHAAAADPTVDYQPVTITLTKVTPTVATAGATVTLTGTVTNSSPRPIHRVQVHLWRSRELISSSASLEQAFKSAPDDPLGARLLDVEKGQVQTLPSLENSTLQPGESATFTLHAPVSGESSFGFTEDDAVALIGVHVRGAPEGEPNQTVGRARTLLPILGSQAPAYSEIVLLASAPSQLTEKTFADDHLAAELTGRLATLLDRALMPGRTVVLDPELFEAVTAMAKGYEVTGSTASTAAGQKAAADWLARLEPLFTSGRLYQGVYGTPNLALAAATRDPSLASDAHEAAQGLRTATLPLAAVQKSGEAGQQVVDYLAGEDLKLLVTRQTPTPGVFTGPVTVASLADPTRVPRPGTPSDAQRAGSRAAMDLISYREGRVPVHLVTEPDDIAQLSSLAQFRVVPVASAATGNATVGPGAADLAADATLSTQIDRARAVYGVWTQLSGDYSAVGDPSKVLSRAWSTEFADPTQATAWVQAATTRLTGYLSAPMVTIKAARSFVTGSGDVRIPLTLTNRLPTPISVRLSFDSENPQRITIPDVDPIMLSPGESDTIAVTPKAASNAMVAFTATVVTHDGTRVSTPVSFTVQATSMGDVGWVIIIASGALLLGATAWRIRAVQRARRRLGDSPRRVARRGERLGQTGV